jgi:hypothetical protein
VNRSVESFFQEARRCGYPPVIDEIASNGEQVSLEPIHQGQLAKPGDRSLANLLLRQDRVRGFRHGRVKLIYTNGFTKE